MRKPKFSKRLTAVVLSVLIAATMAMPVCAAEKATTPVTQNKVVLRTARSILTSGADEISGGSGSFTCDLGEDNWDALIMAGVASSDESGLVTCCVHTPDGHDYTLGDVPASGGHTPLIHFTFCQAGTYTFYFTASTSATLDVYGRIYDE